MKLFAKKYRESRRRRRGITLIEVLIAVGVAAVGMFGVFVLIPMCARQAELGQVYDEASAVSKSAVARVEVEGMANPANWRRTDPTDPMNPATQPFPVDVSITRDSDTPVDGVPDWKQNSYCMDPQRLAVDRTNNLFPTPSTLPVGRTPGQRCIERITYAKILGTPANAQALASHVFQTDDDFQYQSFDDKQKLPAQQYVKGTVAGTLVPLIRTSRGRTSWMAMFEPQPGMVGSDLYRLYIVTFNKRLLNIDTSNGSERTTEEFVFEPDNTYMLPDTAPVSGNVLFHSSRVALSGGDLTLKGALPEGNRMRRNGWVMLQSQFDQSVFAWYRVVRADNDEAAGEIHLTIEGGDWPLNRPGDTPPGLGTPRVIFIPEVAMVYEKTIKLGDESPFSID